MHLNRSVKTVTMIDKSGYALEEVASDSFTNLSLSQSNNTHFMECILDISLGKDYDDLYGPIRYHHSEKDDFIMFSFPFEDKIIVVTSTKNISLISLATEIGRVVMNQTRSTNYLVNN